MEWKCALNFVRFGGFLRLHMIRYIVKIILNDSPFIFSSSEPYILHVGQPLCLRSDLSALLSFFSAADVLGSEFSGSCRRAAGIGTFADVVKNLKNSNCEKFHLSLNFFKVCFNFCLKCLSQDTMDSMSGPRLFPSLDVTRNVKYLFITKRFVWLIVIAFINIFFIMMAIYHRHHNLVLRSQ